MASQFIKLPVTGGGGGGGSGVTSFNARTGVVVSQAGDYSASLISNTPSGSISSTTVQNAINELDVDVQANSSAISALTTVVAGKQPLDSDLTAIAALTTFGLIARTSTGVVNTRTITAGSNIAITNGDGVAGDLTVALSGTIPIANGGLGITTTPAIGAIPIGTGTGYSAAQLTAGAGLSITNAAGSITLNLAVPINYDIDGGNATSVYGGTTPINGGTA